MRIWTIKRDFFTCIIKAAYLLVAFFSYMDRGLYMGLVYVWVRICGRVPLRIDTDLWVM